MKTTIVEFGVWGDLLLVLYVCGMVKEIAAGPDNFTSTGKVLYMFWRRLLGVCGQLVLLSLHKLGVPNQCGNNYSVR